MTAGLTAGQKRHFDEDGFCLIENFLREGEISDLTRLTDTFYVKSHDEYAMGPNDPFPLRNMVAIEKMGDRARLEGGNALE